MVFFRMVFYYLGQVKLGYILYWVAPPGYILNLLKNNGKGSMLNRHFELSNIALLFKAIFKKNVFA